MRTLLPSGIFEYIPLSINVPLPRIWKEVFESTENMVRQTEVGLEDIKPA